MRIVGPMFFSCLVLLGACSREPNAAASSSRQITVFAASSTTDVMREIADLYQHETGVAIVFSFDSSSNLASQIKSGAPADIFISADERWMDDVAAAGAIQLPTRRELLANELVMIAPGSQNVEVRMTRDFNFAAALPQIKRIAIADPTHVPAGMYAKQSLDWLGWWPQIEKLLIPARDVRAALRLVEIGEADAGIVYSTDAKQSGTVKVIATFPPDSHEPIHYPIALCANARADAASFLDFLRTPDSIKVFEREGFGVLPAVRVADEGAGR